MSTKKPPHIHILGICGTFMGGLAVIARQAGFRVTGCDSGVYPPMSTQLNSMEIDLIEGWDPSQLDLQPDVFVVGNVVTRGNPLMEAILEQNLPYISGPQWLYENVIRSKWVLAVAGTHGKTTTSSMLTKILDDAGLNPSFLIGGVPNDFPASSRLTDSDFFVIEADEYDTAFFDKRSKFLHYHPRTLVLGNLEFDHADIFDDLKAIERQFHHLVRMIPKTGALIVNQDSPALKNVLDMGCWSEAIYFGQDANGWSYLVHDDGARIDITNETQIQGTFSPDFFGRHNLDNAMAAILAARHCGIPIEVSCQALEEFSGVKRRMSSRGIVNDVEVFDDFAHHPTAIKATVDGLKARYPNSRVHAVLEPRSNTMRRGDHKGELASSLVSADTVHLYSNGLIWDAQQLFCESQDQSFISDDIDALVRSIINETSPGDKILVMSNGHFENVHDRILDALKKEK